MFYFIWTLQKSAIFKGLVFIFRDTSVQCAQPVVRNPISAIVKFDFFATPRITAHKNETFYSVEHVCLKQPQMKMF